MQVNRDTLFSFHPVPERMLQKMLALYVSSHYKNTPNDLQLMSDAPAHQLFVLIPPVNPDDKKLPEPLCVIQVALEGQISRESVLYNLSRGERAGGDLIPWLVSQQFQDADFGALSGARIVRIATSPEYISMGYGRRALELLVDFYEGKFASLDENGELVRDEMVRVTDEELASSTLLQDNVKVRDIKSMPPLFARLSEKPPPRLDYVGVSYGLTQQLHKFWKRAGFVPVYLRQTPNDLTGEHTCVMIRTLHHSGPDLDDRDASWLPAFSRDFHRRFLSLLSYQFRTFPSVLALSIDESAQQGIKQSTASSDPADSQPISKAELDESFSPFDLKRLDSYANNMLDYHVILDMLPRIAELYFTGRIRQTLSLSGVQTALLLAIGLQRKTLEDVEAELGLGSSQLLAMFVKVMRKVSSYFRLVVEGAAGADLPSATEHGVGAMEGLEEANGDTNGKSMKPLDLSLAEELKEAGNDFMVAEDAAERERVRAMIDALPLDKYAKAGDDDGADWAEAEKQVAKGARSTVAVKNLKRKGDGEKKRKPGQAIEEASKEIPAGKKLKKGKNG